MESFHHKLLGGSTQRSKQLPASIFWGSVGNFLKWIEINGSSQSDHGDSVPCPTRKENPAESIYSSRVGTGTGGVGHVSYQTSKQALALHWHLWRELHLNIFSFSWHILAANLLPWLCIGTWCDGRRKHLHAFWSVCLSLAAHLHHGTGMRVPLQYPSALWLTPAAFCTFPCR